MTFSDIGISLKKAREAKGLKLENIHELTKIPLHYLLAIEEGNHDIMPEPVYVNGFIKRIAEALNIDPTPFTKEYKTWVNSLDNNKNDSNRHLGFPATNTVTNSPNLGYKPKHENPSQNLFKAVYYPLILIPIMVLLVVFLYNKQVENVTTQTSSTIDIPNNLSNSTPKPSTNSSTDTNNNQSDLFANPGTQATDNDSNTFKIKAKQHVWVTVRNLQSNDPLFNGFLEAGDERSFENNNGLKIRVGNGGSLDYSYLNKTQSFGKPGSPCERTFTAQDNVANNLSNPNGQDASTNLTNTEKNDSTSSTTPSTTASKPVPKPVAKPKTAKAKSSQTTVQSDIKKVLDVPYRYPDE